MNIWQKEQDKVKRIMSKDFGVQGFSIQHMNLITFICVKLSVAPHCPGGAV